MAWDQAADPLGIDLRQRAQERQTQFELNNPTARLRTVPHDPRWDAYFQAMDMAGVNRLADQSVGEAKGMFPASPDAVSTYDPNYQSSAVDSMPSNQVGTPGIGAPTGVFGSSIPAMDALSRATGGFAAKGMPQFGRGRQFMKVRGQRGTGGNNSSERG